MYVNHAVQGESHEGMLWSCIRAKLGMQHCYLAHHRQRQQRASNGAVT